MNVKPTSIAAIVMFLGVALGAFGAHALSQTLDANGTQATWRTASFYHLVHGVALLVPAVQASKWARRLILLGILVFSGSLYVLALSGLSWLGAITPLGGLSLLGGWVALAIKPSSFADQDHA